MITFTNLGKMGRLGNQLFQIATCIGVAEKTNDKYIFPKWEYEKNFCLHNCYSDSIKVNNSYAEPYFHYKEIKTQPGQVTDLVGYWQSYKYFNNCQELILGLLTPKTGFSIKYNCTSIHVRRGDYTKLTKEYEQLNMDYYNKAMKAVNSKNYIVVSDDINYCKSIFKGDNISFSEYKNPIDDLGLMISCEHNIIANSTFSWWGAYLNKNPSKIIIAPNKWFGPALNHDTKDLIPNSWIKL